MYCIQMHFQLVALKLEALSPRLTLSRSKSLAKIAKFCFSIRTSSTSHTLKKLRTKKSTCKSLAQSPKLCSALLEIELDCVTGGSLPSLFLPLLVSIFLVSHTACQQYRHGESSLPPGVAIAGRPIVSQTETAAEVVNFDFGLTACV